MKTKLDTGCSAAVVLALMSLGAVHAATPAHIYEKVELTFTAAGKYANPYTDAEVWVDLKGPNFAKRCYGYWDGGQTFRVRIMALEPGTWSWVSGSNPPDSGIAGKTGSFQTVAWTDAEKQQNQNRRGIPHASPNGHALQWSDGTPYFIQGDFFYPASTSRYIWRDSDKSYPVDSPRAGFKDMLLYRKKQGFNMIYIISSFPNWGYDGWPHTFSDEAGVPVRGAWPNGDENRAENMVNEENEKPFFFPGKAVGYSEVGADFWRINPSYFRYLDKKVDYAAANGFQIFIETIRRDMGPYMKAYYGASNPDLSKNAVFYYIRYIFNRYQADPVLFGIIHQDVGASRKSTTPGLGPEDWRPVIDGYHKKYGHPPFGQIVTTNISGSTYRVWGHTDKSPWLMLHQAGNFPRDNASTEEILEMFRLPKPIPAYNQEPWYISTDTPAERMRNRGIMYGCVLSGGLAGVAYQAYGMTRGNRESKEDMPQADSDDPKKHGPFPNMWQTIKWQSANEVQYVRKFMDTEKARYQDLAPHPEFLSVSKTGDWPVAGWAFLLRTDDKQLFKVYFQAKAARADVTGALPNVSYKAQWFDPRTGAWSNAANGKLTSDAQGKIALPATPNSDEDWALNLSTR